MREKTLKRFKEKATSILVATDVAARWIDVEWLSHVINYSLPENPEVYTHRIGRTGRAGKTWKAISLVTRSDFKFLKQIEYFTKKSIDKKPIPNGEEIIAIKKDRILLQIADKINSQEEKKYLAITNNLLSKYNDSEIIEALLEIIYKNDLNPHNYKNIWEENFKWWKSNNIRIFIAKWRIDNFWAKDIVNFIADNANINPNDINDVELFDKFSYANVWLAEADLILKHFKKQNPRKPLIVKAKEKWGSSRRGWRWGYRGNSSRWGSRNSRGWDRRNNSRWNSRGRNSRWRK
jgi:ATP-dependent RNA helicase DeaD